MTSFLLNFNRSPWRIIILLGLWAFHGIQAFIQFQIASNLEISLLFQLMRFIFISWILFVVVLIFFIFCKSKTLTYISEKLNKAEFRDRLVSIFLFFLFLRVFLWVLEGYAVGGIKGYLQILKPALDLGGYISFEIILLVLIRNFAGIPISNQSLFRFFAFFGILLTALVGLVFLVSMTGLGIVSGYKGDWQRGLPSVPLLEWQILLALLFGICVYLLDNKMWFRRIYWLDGWICIFIWLCTILMWTGQPVIPNPSALEPRAPNFEIYPFIDAQVYDQFSQSIIAGQGFGLEKIPQRPLYVVFLAFLHLLIGQDYSSLIFAQSLVFALFPVLLFVLGKDFMGRPLGVVIASLAIFRDFVSNYVSPYTGNLSYSKVLLSEIPTAILLILVLILSMRWIRSGFSYTLAFLIGGVLGAAILVRTQAFVALPVILFFTLLAGRQHIRALIRSMLILCISLALTVSPWLWRNWNLTGHVIFDNPESQTANLALRYSRLNGEEPQVIRLPGETSVAYSARLSTIANKAIWSNPIKAIWGVSNAFLNHGVNNILLFPLREEIRDWRDVMIPSDAFWEKWEGQPTWHQSVLLAFYVFLFGLGVSVSWLHNGWLGLMPLGLNLCYNLWTSLALLSGQRFMLTMDWSVYLYYMVGLMALIGGLLFAINRTRPSVLKWVKTNSFERFEISTKGGKTAQVFFFGALFFVVGASLPLSERIFSDKYSQPSKEVLLQRVLNMPALHLDQPLKSCIEDLDAQGAINYSYGLALYPRYYGPGEGEVFTDKVGYKPTDRGRIVFELIANHSSQRIIIPMAQSPEFFPHTADTILVHGENDTVWMVLVQQGDSAGFYVSDAFDSAVCRSE